MNDRTGMDYAARLRRLYNRIASLLVRVSAALGLMMLLTTAAQAQSETSELRVGLYPGAPFVMEQNGAMTGFSVDLWQAVAARLNAKTNYQIVPDVSTLERALVSRRVDLIASLETLYYQRRY